MERAILRNNIKMDLTETRDDVAPSIWGPAQSILWRRQWTSFFDVREFREKFFLFILGLFKVFQLSALRSFGC
jgi:hypothetical protein